MLGLLKRLEMAKETLPSSSSQGNGEQASEQAVRTAGSAWAGRDRAGENPQRSKEVVTIKWRGGRKYFQPRVQLLCKSFKRQQGGFEELEIRGGRVPRRNGATEEGEEFALNDLIYSAPPWSTSGGFSRAAALYPVGCSVPST